MRIAAPLRPERLAATRERKDGNGRNATRPSGQGPRGIAGGGRRRGRGHARCRQRVGGAGKRLCGIIGPDAPRRGENKIARAPRRTDGLCAALEAKGQGRPGAPAGLSGHAPAAGNGKKLRAVLRSGPLRAGPGAEPARDVMPGPAIGRLWHAPVRPARAFRGACRRKVGGAAPYMPQMRPDSPLGAWSTCRAGRNFVKKAHGPA